MTTTLTRRRSWAAVRRRRVVEGTATEAGGMCAVPPWVQRGSVRHHAQVSVRIVGPCVTWQEGKKKANGNRGNFHFVLDHNVVELAKDARPTHYTAIPTLREPWKTMRQKLRFAPREPKSPSQTIRKGFAPTTRFLLSSQKEDKTQLPIFGRKS